MTVAPRSGQSDERDLSAGDGIRHEFLRAMVGGALDLLGDLRAPHPAVVSGALEKGLRRGLDQMWRNNKRHAPSDGEQAAMAAVRTACAHLATRAYEDAYLALLTAQAMLPG